MLKPKSAATTLAVTDIDRAKRFYGETLGLKETDKGPHVGNDATYALPDGSRVYVYQRDKPPGGDQTQVAFVIDDIDTALKDLRKAGVEPEEYDRPGLKTENGIAETGGVRGAWIRDPDGNVLRLTEPPT